MNRATVARGDALDGSLSGGDIERAAGTHRKRAHMPPCRLQGRGHVCLDQIAGLKPTHPLSPHAIAPREPGSVYVGSLILAAPHRLDQQSPSLSGIHPRWIAYTECIQRVRLGQPKAVAVPARATATAAVDWQTKRAQPRHQRIAGRIHGRRIGEGLFCLGLDRRVPKLGCRPIPLRLIADVTGQAQIADPVRAAPTFGYDMLDFQHLIGRAAVRATPVPLLQQIGPDFPPGKGSLLVVQPGESGILQELGSKTNSLDVETTERDQAQIAPCPGEDIPYPACKRRRQPAFPPSPVEKARCSIPQVGAAAPAAPAAPAALGGALGQGGMHRYAPMGQVRQMQCVLDRSRRGDFLAGKGQPSRAAPRVHLQHDRLEGARFHQPIFEPNGEGRHPMDDRPLAGQQLPRSLLRAGHQRAFASIYYKHRQTLPSLLSPKGRP